jgi:hypothetical protein
MTMTRTAGRNVFQNAIGATALALIFIVPALFGCNLHKSDSIFVACTPWSETVLWDRVGIGMAVLLVATYFWRRAIRSVTAPRSQERSVATRTQ